ncbi:N6-adenine-specific DNA methyltransferase 1 [Piptocephalis cylindrospora]|uniref:N6-adenine-specific DNA methyltransferase 1 n=1 Tax=Piptocephalis cylindrospora TaxID=1907219 RepID=A0A4P9Y6H8_9FUNG|nr:N6-adenine-specific DNA methyltransferase 1 [Piptocephalis cylindrospora]|eukprot:RKP14314.1 N6-adenine-specific DNA methyltransferase 1 [Piptocephalis cylindrospora]
MSYPTPDHDHILKAPYRDAVYEPAEDTFLLLDALEGDASLLTSLLPRVCLEIGSGSGCALTFLSTLLGPKNAVYMATDINALCTHATLETGKRALTQIDPIRTDLVHGLRLGNPGMVDILLFNPPYVPTDPSEVGSHGIEASWAGGKEGREVLDRLLPLIHRLLSPKGIFYLVAVEENRPEDIASILQAHGVVARRKTGPEALSIWRYSKIPL